MSDPECTCTNVEPRHESVIVPGGGSSYALYLDCIEDDSIIDPDCYYHGDDGTMVLTITYPNKEERMAGEKSLTALDRANEIRLARAARFNGKKDHSPEYIASLLDDIPEDMESMPIAGLLRYTRNWGPGKARRTLERLQIVENKPLSKLTQRQVGLITRTLLSGHQ